MKIQVLGSGCPTCQKLHEMVLKVAKEFDLENQVEYLSGAEGIAKIMEIGAMSSPVLVIDGKIIDKATMFNPEKLTEILKKE
mgnify:CR=1 FL=1